MSQTHRPNRAGVAYVRTAPPLPVAPPMLARGPLRWIRDNLFSSVFSSVLTLLLVALLVLLIPPLAKFLVIDAVWSGTDREACLATEARPQVGACWAFVREWFSFFIYGPYPADQRWRVDLFFALLAFGAAWLLWLDAPRREWQSNLTAVRVPGQREVEAIRGGRAEALGPMTEEQAKVGTARSARPAARSASNDDTTNVSR